MTYVRARIMHTLRLKSRPWVVGFVFLTTIFLLSHPSLASLVICFYFFYAVSDVVRLRDRSIHFRPNCVIKDGRSAVFRSMFDAEQGPYETTKDALTVFIGFRLHEPYG